MTTYALTQDHDLHVHTVATNNLSPVTLIVTEPDGRPVRHEGEPNAASWDLRGLRAGTVLTTDPDVIPGGAELTVSGSADALYRLLWNRIGTDSPQIRVAGELAPFEIWRATVAIT